MDWSVEAKLSNPNSGKAEKELQNLALYMGQLDIEPGPHRTKQSKHNSVLRLFVWGHFFHALSASISPAGLTVPFISIRRGNPDQADLGLAFGTFIHVQPHLTACSCGSSPHRVY